MSKKEILNMIQLIPGKDWVEELGFGVRVMLREVVRWCQVEGVGIEGLWGKKEYELVGREDLKRMEEGGREKKKETRKLDLVGFLFFSLIYVFCCSFDRVNDTNDFEDI